MRPNWVQQILPTNETIIKAIFAVHFAMVAWLMESRDLIEHKGWHLAFYNGFLFVTLFWSLLEPKSPHPIQLATIIEFMCIGVDVRIICRLHVFDGTWFFPFEFSVWYLSLGMRLIAFVALWQICRDGCDQHETSRHHSSHRKSHRKSLPLPTIEEIPLQSETQVKDDIKETV